MRSVFRIDESIGETMRLFEMLMSCAAVQVNRLAFFEFGASTGSDCRFWRTTACRAKCVYNVFIT